jgi:formylglycine-generating enzyme required for sulfatase activity
LAPLESFREPAPENKNQLQRFILPVGVALLALAIVGGAVAFALNRNEASTVPPPSPSITVTLTPAPPTMTPTITPIPAPVEVPDEHGVSMRLVSPSDFMMGSDAGMEDEGQAQLLYLDTFYIDKYEVTNSQYRACVTAGACLAPKKLNSSTRAGYYNKPEFNSYPIVFVDWNMARNYCEWRGARLPTEAEWEKAARGPEGSLYPWGEEISCEEANFSGCQKDTAAVSSFANAVSAYGVYNMAGNVYEWVSSLYKPYPYDLFDGREDLEAPGERVLRGGSWLSTDRENEVRSAHREKADPATAKENIGFRCARTPNESFLDFALVVNTPSNGSTATAFVATSRSGKTKEASIPTATSTPRVIPTTAKPPTGIPPTGIPTTAVPPTNVTPTDIPPTDIPPTDIPPTDIPPTDIPPTDIPPTNYP